MNRREIENAAAYIETRRLDKFDVEAVAAALFLSVSHFSHVFKAYAGMTSHDYYTEIKLGIIRDKLLDMDISVDEVFSRCGVDYHGCYAGLFKMKTGFSHSGYRKMALKWFVTAAE